MLNTVSPVQYLGFSEIQAEHAYQLLYFNVPFFKFRSNSTLKIVNLTSLAQFLVKIQLFSRIM